MQHARPNRLRRAFAYAALAALLGVVAFTLSQCTMVGDNLTGVGSDRAKPTDCFHKCILDAQIAAAAEVKRYQAEKEACGGDAACEAAATAKHDANMAAINAGKVECQNSCNHRQGAGSAG